MASPTWKSQPDGSYRLVNGPCEAKLAKAPCGSWWLTVPGHRPVDLGERATFGHAETAISEITARPSDHVQAYGHERQADASPTAAYERARAAGEEVA